MPDRKLKIIPKPDTTKRTVFSQDAKPGTVFIRGAKEAKGDTNLLCGNCGAVLVATVPDNMIRNIVFECYVCDSYNDAE